MSNPKSAEEVQCNHPILQLLKDRKTNIQQPARRVVAFHPYHLLSHVAKAINTALPDLEVSTPHETTWQKCLDTVSKSLSGLDRKISIDPPIPTLRKRALRNQALQQAQAQAQASFDTNMSLTKPIRNQYDTNQEEPYPVVIPAALESQTLPTITAKVILEGIDDGSKIDTLENAVMLFDTGAHHTIISSDVLSPGFRDYLENDPVHDPYRLEGGCRVQLIANVEFTNTYIRLCTIALVVNRSAIPNSPSGIIFGQKGCLDSICFRSVPAKFLQPQDDDAWGGITVDRYIDPDGEIAMC
ncbi:hypothetical protein ACJ72_06819 [Emergomyces africanus]|uniref:Peptidase A2 domain-containing protein n=1 Tax=Emergomyces africanus TaxID=1955775 RepID=A0A1B7NQG5_9EURO|nr:hypothetical protein ACJ72_06819 [Emergomyces africanus]